MASGLRNNKVQRHLATPDLRHWVVWTHGGSCGPNLSTGVCTMAWREVKGYKRKITEEGRIKNGNSFETKPNTKLGSRFVWAKCFFFFMKTP